jgi:hypothetical protein
MYELCFSQFLEFFNIISHFICNLYNCNTINKYFDKERIQSCRKTFQWKFSINEAFSYILNINSRFSPFVLFRVVTVCKSTGYGLDDRGGQSYSSDRVSNFLFSTSFITALGPNRSPV